MTGQRHDSYVEFWHHYLREHSDPGTRLAHYAGTSLAVGAAILFAITAHWAWLLLMPVLGYGFAWISHGFIERNSPATFTNPLWSLLSDLRMLFLAVAGRLDRHLRAANDGNEIRNI